MRSQITKSPQDQRGRMQWFVLIVISFIMLASLIAGIAIAFFTKSIISLAIPSSTVLLMRPIIKYLFPSEER